MELSRAATGGFVLNDSYNANPASTEAALRALAALPARRRLAVLGPMLELGAHTVAEHRRIGELAATLDIEVIAVGAPDYGGEDVADLEAATARVGDVEADEAVLVKGSRAAGLDRLAATLSQTNASTDASSGGTEW
jgi:UDP-N-acetylmuramoyl-tripeptide--D-alanyl-D-alanine ligase